MPDSPPRRSLTLWPLPGGAGGYLDALARILRIARRTASSEAAAAGVVAEFDRVTSGKTARSYLHVAASLGLLDLDGSLCEVTREGSAFLTDRDPRQIRRLLIQRIAGVEELLDIVAQRPRRIGLLHEEMTRLGFTWARQTQVRYRLRWLEEVGAVRREGTARPVYRITDAQHP